MIGLIIPKYNYLTGTHCIYCKREFTNEKPLTRTKDHIIPKIRGGQNRLFNYVASCDECNRLKNDMLPKEFADCLKSVINSGNAHMLPDHAETIIKNAIKLHRHIGKLKRIFLISETPAVEQNAKWIVAKYNYYNHAGEGASTFPYYHKL